MTRNSRGRPDGFFISLVVPACILRFALIYPLLICWTYSTNHHNLVVHHEELHNGIFGTKIAAGEKLARYWTKLAFIWNLAVWIPSCLIFAPLNLPLAVMDTIVAVYLSMSVHHQTGYAPHDKGQCSDARHLQRPPGANESFFEAAARLNATATSPEKMCQTFFTEWRFGISAAVLYTVISVLNLTAFYRSIHDAKRRGITLLEQSKRVTIYMRTLLLSIPRLFFMLGAFVLYWVPTYLFRCLPFSVKSKVRFARRSAVKTGLGLEQMSEMQIITLKDKLGYLGNDSRRYQSTEGTKSPLSDFLGIYDILILVAENLHYNDLVSLSRVSKSVREAVLPTNDQNRRLNVYRIYSCLGEQKIPCWSCPNQICTECWHYSLVPPTPLYHHLENCIPYCKSCYTTYISQVFGHRLKDPFCSCAPVPQHPNILLRVLKGDNYYTKQRSRYPNVSRAVCRDCSSFTGLQLSEKRQRRTRMQVMQGRNWQGKKWTRCAREGCGRELVMGPRWWVCTKSGCGKECTSLVHKAWGDSNEKENNEGGTLGVEVV